MGFRKNTNFWNLTSPGIFSSIMHWKSLVHFFSYGQGNGPVTSSKFKMTKTSEPCKNFQIWFHTSTCPYEYVESFLVEIFVWDPNNRLIMTSSKFFQIARFKGFHYFFFISYRTCNLYHTYVTWITNINALLVSLEKETDKNL